MAVVDGMESNLNPESNSQQTRRGRLGFTLLEIALAVTIAIGIMVVALFFYEQSARLRKDALEEMDRITAVRLVMDRLSSELRCAVPGSDLLDGVKGSASSIEFIRLDPPVRGSLLTNESGEMASVRMQPTFKKTCYRIAPDPAGGLSVLKRIEEPIFLRQTKGNSAAGQKRQGATNNPAGEAFGLETNIFGDLNSGFDATNLLSENLDGEEPDPQGTNAEVLFAGDEFWGDDAGLQQSDGFMAMEGLIDEGTPQEKKIVISNVFARGIGYFNLRYYDGSQWVTSWNSKELPLGIEIRMAAEDPETEEAKAAREAEEEAQVFEQAFSVLESAGSETNGSAAYTRETTPYEDLGLEQIEDIGSGLDTNVVVFQRIIYLPNARKQTAASVASLSGGPDAGATGADTLGSRRGR